MGNGLASQLLFLPPSPPTPFEPHQTYFWIETATQVLIPAIFIPYPKARYTLLYSHGHDVDLGLIHNFLVDLSRLLGVNIMSYDYGGYGVGRKVSVIFPHRHRKLHINRKKPIKPTLRTKSADQCYSSDEEDNDDDNDNDHDLEIDSNDDNDHDGNSNNDGNTNNNNNNNSQSHEVVEPSEEQCYADIEACHNYLVYNKGIPPAHIILYGKSLGSGPTCWLAQKLYHRFKAQNNKNMIQQIGSRGGGGGDGFREGERSGGRIGRRGSDGRGGRGHKVQYYSTNGTSLDDKTSEYLRSSPTKNGGGNRGGTTGSMEQNHADPCLPMGGLILHSAFLSVMRIMVNSWFTAGDCFENIDRICNIHCPIYVIHGKEDDVIPFSHGQQLYKSIAENGGGKAFPPFWADDAAHNNIESKYATAYVKRLQQFIRHCDNRVTKECGENVGERARYMKGKSVSMTRRKSYGTPVPTNAQPRRGRSPSVSRKNGNLKQEGQGQVQHRRSVSRGRQLTRNQGRGQSVSYSKSAALMPGRNDGDPGSSRAATMMPQQQQHHHHQRRQSATTSSSEPTMSSTTLKPLLKAAPIPNTDARRNAPASNARGRSRDTRNPRSMLDKMNRARSNSRAKERKKRGTLVMKGTPGNEEDESRNALVRKTNAAADSDDHGGLTKSIKSHKNTGNGVAYGGGGMQVNSNEGYSQVQGGIERESRNPSH